MKIGLFLKFWVFNFVISVDSAGASPTETNLAAASSSSLLNSPWMIVLICVCCVLVLLAVVALCGRCGLFACLGFRDEKRNRSDCDALDYKTGM
jgi:hypothetical protein